MPNLKTNRTRLENLTLITEDISLLMDTYKSRAEIGDLACLGLSVIFPDTYLK